MNKVKMSYFPKIPPRSHVVDGAQERRALREGDAVALRGEAPPAEVEAVRPAYGGADARVVGGVEVGQAFFFLQLEVMGRRILDRGLIDKKRTNSM